MMSVDSDRSAGTQTCPWTPQSCTRDNIQKKVCEKFKAIVADSENRKNNYKTDHKLLNAGFWYPNDFCKALADCKETARLEELKANGAFFHGLPPTGFDHVEDQSKPGHKSVVAYTLKKGVLPADALRSVRESVCFFDCQEAIELAYYETLLEVWGEQVFNQQFGHEGKRPLSFHMDIVKTPLEPFLLQKVFLKVDESFYRSIKKGDELFFRNVPVYSYKHPEGDMGGFHCICSQGGKVKKFLGFGAPQAGVTEDQTLGLFAEAFNDPQMKLSDLYSGEFLKKMVQCFEPPPAEVSRALPTMVLTIRDIKDVQSQYPEKAGLQPSTRRFDVLKVRNRIPQ